MEAKKLMALIAEYSLTAGTVAAILAAALLWWSSVHSGRKAAQEREEIRTETAARFDAAAEERGEIRTEVQNGFDAILALLEPNGDETAAAEPPPAAAGTPGRRPLVTAAPPRDRP